MERNATNELAKERNREAAERTLTAWIGQCLALIAFGFAFERIVRGLHRSPSFLQPAISDDLARTIGLVTVGLGIGLLALAAIMHQSFVRSLERPLDARHSSSILFTLVPAAIALFGLIALLATFLKAQ